MSDDAAAEAEKLRAKARELKEEVASLSGTTVEEMEKKEAAAETVVEKKSGDLYDDEVCTSYLVCLYRLEFQTVWRPRFSSFFDE